jgi:hypothetical protein
MFPLISLSEIHFCQSTCYHILFLGLVVNVGAFYLQLYGQKLSKHQLQLYIKP